MKRKQVFIFVALVSIAGVLFLILGGVFKEPKNRRGEEPEPVNISPSSNGKQIPGEADVSGTNTVPRPLFYAPEVPEGATLTKPKNEAPASPNKTDIKARYFDLRAAKSGFDPRTITVNLGDTVYLDLSAEDGDYDFEIPYLGAYFWAVPKGTTRRLPFDATMSGTFTFQCRSFCPREGVIQGELIVLP